MVVLQRVRCGSGSGSGAGRGTLYRYMDMLRYERRLVSLLGS